MATVIASTDYEYQTLPDGWQKDADNLQYTTDGWALWGECPFCGKKIVIDEQVILATVVTPHFANGGLVTIDVVDDDGDYTYDPTFYHQECWSEMYYDYENFIKHKKPVGCASSLVECDLCTSDILAEETSVLVLTGNVTKSPRSPNNLISLSFEVPPGLAYRAILCIECASKMKYTEGNHSALWPGLDHSGECERGLRERCWRSGCSTSCKYG